MPGHLVVGYMTLNHVTLVRIQARQHESARYRGRPESLFSEKFLWLVLDQEGSPA